MTEITTIPRSPHISGRGSVSLQQNSSEDLARQRVIFSKGSKGTLLDFIGVMMTSTEAQMLSVSLDPARCVLIEALKGCKKQADLAAAYNAFLLGLITEEEYEEEAKEYLVTEHLSDEELSRRMHVLRSETSTDFAAEQVAFMFSSPLTQVKRVMRSRDALS